MDQDGFGNSHEENESNQSTAQIIRVGQVDAPHHPHPAIPRSLLLSDSSQNAYSQLSPDGDLASPAVQRQASTAPRGAYNLDHYWAVHPSNDNARTTASQIQYKIAALPTIAQSSTNPRSGQVSASRRQHTATARSSPSSSSASFDSRQHVHECQSPPVVGVTLPAVQAQADTKPIQLSNDIIRAIAGKKEHLDGDQKVGKSDEMLQRRRNRNKLTAARHREKTKKKAEEDSLRIKELERYNIELCLTVDRLEDELNALQSCPCRCPSTPL